MVFAGELLERAEGNNWLELDKLPLDFLDKGLTQPLYPQSGYIKPKVTRVLIDSKPQVTKPQMRDFTKQERKLENKVRMMEG